MIFSRSVKVMVFAALVATSSVSASQFAPEYPFNQTQSAAFGDAIGSLLYGCAKGAVVGGLSALALTFGEMTLSSYFNRDSRMVETFPLIAIPGAVLGLGYQIYKRTGSVYNAASLLNILGNKSLVDVIMLNNAALIMLWISYDHEGDIVTVDNEGRSPLIIAVQYKCVNSAKALIKAGVPLNTKDADGFTALDYAQKNNDQAMIELLQRHNA
jgi:hypothetical protein